VRAYRIGSARHTLWDGMGAAIHGARWNSPGRGPIYAAESYGGALLEVLARMGAIQVPPDYHYVEITIPDDMQFEEILPSPQEIASESFTRSCGDKWFDARRTPVLYVPSVVTGVERNLLINPRHPEFFRIQPSEPKPVPWDRRFFRA
jgi:RES domain-containing protein